MRDTPIDSFPFEAHRHHTQGALNESDDLCNPFDFFLKHWMASKLVLQFICGPFFQGVRRSCKVLICRLLYRALFWNGIARHSLSLSFFYAMAILFSPSLSSIREVYWKQGMSNHWGYELSVTSRKSPNIDASVIEVLWSISYVGESPYSVPTLAKKHVSETIPNHDLLEPAANRKPLAVSYDLPPRLNDVYFTIKFWVCEADMNRDLTILPFAALFKASNTKMLWILELISN